METYTCETCGNLCTRPYCFECNLPVDIDAIADELGTVKHTINVPTYISDEGVVDEWDIYTVYRDIDTHEVIYEDDDELLAAYINM